MLASDFSTLGAYVVYGSGHLAPGSPLFSGVWCFDLDDLKWKGRNVPGMPVVEGGKLGGMLSDRDLLLHASLGKGYEFPDGLTAGSIMTKVVFTQR